MRGLPEYLLEDAFGLADELRKCERRDEHSAAAAVCEALAKLNAWGPIYDYAQRLNVRAQPRLTDQVFPGTPPPWKPTVFHRLTGDPQLGRHAYNAARLLAPIAGSEIARMPDEEPQVVPNPMVLCVRAMRAWYPGGWQRLLSTVVSTETRWCKRKGAIAIEFGDDDEHRVTVDYNGQVEMGPKLVDLHWLPECICMVDDGRVGVCPECRGEPADHGQMCSCVAGRCPRCASGPLFTRRNKWCIVSGYLSE